MTSMVMAIDSRATKWLWFRRAPLGVVVPPRLPLTLFRETDGWLDALRRGLKLLLEFENCKETDERKIRKIKAPFLFQAPVLELC